VSSFAICSDNSVSKIKNEGGVGSVGEPGSVVVVVVDVVVVVVVVVVVTGAGEGGGGSGNGCRFCLTINLIG